MASDLSGRELARLAGISESHPWLIESGQRPHVASHLLAAMARVLGVSLDWLINGEGETPTPEDVQAAVEEARKRYADEQGAA